MDFETSTKYLLSLGNEVSAMKLGLENIRTLLAALGDPQNNYLKIQIAGTNGKGSVCAFLDSICLSAGVSAGTFTSPHLISITERIRINGSDISEEDFARHASRIRDTSAYLRANGQLEYLPTFFEQITAIALTAFAEAKVDLAILETGLGGRLDATTAANAEIAAITAIDYDHQEYLGETLTEIAAEKAAIIHKDSHVVIGGQQREAMEVVIGRCHQMDISPNLDCDASIWAFDTISNSVVASFRTKRDLYDDPNLGLKGRHQLENARIAVMTIEVLRFDFGYDISSDDVVEGLERARHPGRLEFDGKYLFDGAHNVAGIKALREFLDENIDQPMIFVFGVMNEKNVGEMAASLFTDAGRIILTKPDNSRAMAPDGIAANIPLAADREVYLTETVSEALDKANEIASDDDLIVVTGSLYLIGEIKKILKGRSQI